MGSGAGSFPRLHLFSGSALLSPTGELHPLLFLLAENSMQCQDEILPAMDFSFPGYQDLIFKILVFQGVKEEARKGVWSNRSWLADSNGNGMEGMIK